jgi:4-methyl-5(b-hydroxyethyl)-thiazole monophosphate biosynthesis
MKKAVMLFAEGFETVEALMVVDILRRAGVELTMASITEEEMVVSSHGVAVRTDAVLGEVDVMDYDAVILPGGMPGTVNLSESEAVKKTVQVMNATGKIVAAICAAPGLVLGRNELLKGKKACSYPSFEKDLLGAQVVKEPVAVDGNIVTSRGLGTALEFAFALLTLLAGEEKTEEIKKAIVYQELA